MRGQGLQKLYLKGGEALLAYRLNLVFTILNTDAEVTLHNEVIDEIMDIINKDYAPTGCVTGEEKQLLKYIAEILLSKRAKRRNFLYRLAVKVFDVARKKG